MKPNNPSSQDNLSVFLYSEALQTELINMVMSLYSENEYDAPMFPQKVLQTVKHLEANPLKGSVLILKKGEILAGYAMLLNYWSNEYGGDLAVIDELFIRPELRGCGLGQEFLKWVETLPDLKGVMLEVVPDNRAAQVFFTKKGYRPDPNLHCFKRL